MDEDGSAESGRTRLARGTKPQALTGQRELTGAETMDAPTPVASHTCSDAPESPANALPASSDAMSRAPVGNRGAAAVYGGPVPAGAVATAGGAVAAGLDARGSGPVPAGGAPGSASHAPAQSIREAVEQLLEAQEADEAVAEWMQGGG